MGKNCCCLQQFGTLCVSSVASMKKETEKSIKINLEMIQR